MRTILNTDIVLMLVAGVSLAFRKLVLETPASGVKASI